MKLSPQFSDKALMQEIGERLERRRIDAGFTQAQLAQEAGIAKRTVERIEAGNSADFVKLLRVLRALKLVDALDVLLPDQPLSPLVLLKMQGRARKRVRNPRPTSTAADSKPPSTWKWGE
jgi:transcriptional regulator with XRE-family HTH domain